MKLSKTLVLPIAGLLLVAVAGVALATTSAPAPAGPNPVLPAADTATPTPATAPTKAPVVKDQLLSDVLDQLVTKGTISADQKTAILGALDTERTARQTLRKQEAQQLKDILADGIITQAELNTLPAASPLRKLSGLMTNGQISVKDLKSLGFNFLGRGRGFGGHWYGGDKSAAPNVPTSPAPSAATGS